jgi:hypothetical protein
VFKVSVTDDFVTYVPAKKDNVKEFNAGMGNGPSQTTQLDFGKGYSGY